MRCSSRALVTVAFVAVVAAAACACRDMSLRFWQAVMVIALLLPLAQPQRGNEFLLQSIVAIGRGRIGHAAAHRWRPPAFDAPRSCSLILAAGIVVRLAWLGARPDPRCDRSSPRAAPRCLARPIAGRSDALARRHRRRCMVSDELEGPATVGVRRPVILRAALGAADAGGGAARDHLPRAAAREAPRLAAHRSPKRSGARCSGSIPPRA